MQLFHHFPFDPSSQNTNKQASAGTTNIARSLLLAPEATCRGWQITLTSVGAAREAEHQYVVSMAQAEVSSSHAYSDNHTLDYHSAKWDERAVPLPSSTLFPPCAPLPVLWQELLMQLPSQPLTPASKQMMIMRKAVKLKQHLKSSIRHAHTNTNPARKRKCGGDGLAQPNQPNACESGCFHDRWTAFVNL